MTSFESTQSDWTDFAEADVYASDDNVDYSTDGPSNYFGDEEDYLFILAEIEAAAEREDAYAAQAESNFDPDDYPDDDPFGW